MLVTVRFIGSFSSIDPGRSRGFYFPVARMQLTIKLDKKQLDRAIKRAPEEIRKRAIVSGINRTMAMTKTQLVRNVAGEGKLPQKLVRPGMRTIKANFRSLTAKIIPSGRRISMFDLGAKQTAQGVRAGKHFRQSAFIPKIKGRPVFKRDGRSRLPITKQTVAGVRAVASRSTVTKTIEAFANAKLVERINHEIRYRLKRLGL